MNHWPFIIGSYVLTIIATAGILGWSFVAMRGAERAVDDMKGER